MSKLPKTVTHPLSRDVELEVTLEYEDQSFDHEFGTEHQGYFAVTEIKHEGQALPLDMFTELFIAMLEEKYN